MVALNKNAYEKDLKKEVRSPDTGTCWGRNFTQKKVITRTLGQVVLGAFEGHQKNPLQLELGLSRKVKDEVT